MPFPWYLDAASDNFYYNKWWWWWSCLFSYNPSTKGRPSWGETSRKGETPIIWPSQHRLSTPKSQTWTTRTTWQSEGSCV